MTADELERLEALLAVPSVSGLLEHGPDMERAARLVADEIRRAGGTAEVRRGAVHPLVVGEVPPSDGDPDAPVVLAYGHYDVQPVGDTTLWQTPPFTPTVVDGRLVARGACDDKGCLFMLLAATQRLAAEGRLGVRVRFLVDGEEESAGSSAVDWVAGETSLGAAAAALIFDGSMIGPGRPAFYVGLRGISYMRVTVRAAEHDGHSGLFGGAALNAAHALMTVLGAVTSPWDGPRPEISEGALPPTPEELAAWAALPPGASVLADSGFVPADPAAADEFYLRTTALPAVDVHGIACGDAGVVATSIPAVARATLSVRVAPGQDAMVVGQRVERMMREAAPPGARVEVEDLETAQPAMVDPSHPVVRRAADAVERAIGWRPAPVRIGGSLPIVAALVARELPVILTGFYLPEDGVHAPNEGISLEHLDVGTRAAVAILESFGR